MDVLGLLADGFGVALQPLNLAVAFAGVVLGTVVGLLPGIGPINGVAVLIPVTMAAELPPTSVIILFAGIYYGSQYGNSISTVLLNVPGTPSAVVTALDGYAMTRQGRGGPALAISAIASFVGGTISLVGLMLLAPPLAHLAIRFGPAEYFALMVFAFSTLSGLTGPRLVTGLIAAVLGLMLATVGLDPHSGLARYTFGDVRLLDGFDFVVVTIGFFAIGEVLNLIEDTAGGRAIADRIARVMVSARDLARSGWSMLRASVVGFLIGVLPGAGGTIASFLAYATEKRLVDREGTFGTGDIRGVAAPEAANNAAVSGAMIPLLTLGVPGSGTTAVMLAALLAMNVTPGPLLLDRQPELFWGLVASMYIGNLLLLVLNLPLVGLFVRILLVPRWFLIPGVAVISFVAVYAINRSTFDLLLATGFGVIGWALRKLGISLAPVILGLVLGPLMEKNLRRSLALSDGDWTVLFSSPLAVAFWVLAGVALLGRHLVPRNWRRRAEVSSSAASRGRD